MLQAMIIEYLESKGWYFDWEHVNTHLTWYANRDELEVIRQAHAWTVPQWEEYWGDPSKPDEPLKRRYEKLQDALWSQILREEEPETFATFFEEKG